MLPQCQLNTCHGSIRQSRKWVWCLPENAWPWLWRVLGLPLNRWRFGRFLVFLPSTGWNTPFSLVGIVVNSYKNIYIRFQYHFHFSGQGVTQALLWHLQDFHVPSWRPRPLRRCWSRIYLCSLVAKAALPGGRNSGRKAQNGPGKSWLE